MLNNSGSSFMLLFWHSQIQFRRILRLPSSSSSPPPDPCHPRHPLQLLQFNYLCSRTLRRISRTICFTPGGWDGGCGTAKPNPNLAPFSWIRYCKEQRQGWRQSRRAGVLKSRRMRRGNLFSHICNGQVSAAQLQPLLLVLLPG